jgi:hypothetical protein
VGKTGRAGSGREGFGGLLGQCGGPGAIASGLVHAHAQSADCELCSHDKSKQEMRSRTHRYVGSWSNSLMSTAARRSPSFDARWNQNCSGFSESATSLGRTKYF